MFESNLEISPQKGDIEVRVSMTAWRHKVCPVAIRWRHIKTTPNGKNKAFLFFLSSPLGIFLPWKFLKTGKEMGKNWRMPWGKKMLYWVALQISITVPVHDHRSCQKKNKQEAKKYIENRAEIKPHGLRIRQRARRNIFFFSRIKAANECRKPFLFTEKSEPPNVGTDWLWKKPKSLDRA